MKRFQKTATFSLLLLITALLFSSCAQQTRQTRWEELGFQTENREPATSESLITYCPKETAPAAHPEEKKWRDAFSFEVMDRICNQDPQFAKQRFQFHEGGKAKYSESSWVKGINLTGVQHGWPRGTAITSRHLIYTQHYAFHGQVGDTIYFLTMDNRWVSRKIIEVKYLKDVDLAIARLESDLPGSITPFKVLDPEAAALVPDLIPVLRIEQQSKALLVMKKGEGFLPPGEPMGTILSNPPELAYAQYYQPMIRFDSSSPSILLLRTDYGVMPILYSLVTWGGPGTGPLLHKHVTQIQDVIQSFGDSHRLEMAMAPLTGHSAPSCSIEARRSSDGVSCDLIVTGSADPVSGDPIVTPLSPNNWEKGRNFWKGKVSCSSEPTTIFQATLTGPGGVGKTCESGAIGPVLPQCTISVERRNKTQTCDVSVTKLVGNPKSDPVAVSFSPSSWEREGDTWVTTTSCPLNRTSGYSAKLMDDSGEGPSCSTQLEVHPEIPTCEMSSKRVGYNDQCDVIVKRKSGIAIGNPILTPSSVESWVQQGDEYKITVPCSSESSTTYSAYLSGPMGEGPVCKSPSILSVPVEIPFCELQAARQNLTTTCHLLVNKTRGWVAGVPPVGFPENSIQWKQQNSSLTFDGTATCPLNTSTQFSAYYPGLENRPGRPCLASIVEKIPAPACKLEVERQQLTNRCNYTLTAESLPGTIASYNFNAAASRAKWSGANPVRGQFACSQTYDSTFKANVWGPGAGAQTGVCTAFVPKLAPPNCELTVTRRGNSAVCDITLQSSGAIQSANPIFSHPAEGRWYGTKWIGTGVCSRVRAMLLRATIFGTGVYRVSCESPVVPKP